MLGLLDGNPVNLDCYVLYTTTDVIHWVIKIKLKKLAKAYVETKQVLNLITQIFRKS